MAWRAGVKEITRHQQGIDIILLNGLCQPGQKCLELLVAFSAVKGATDMPVGCVKDFHAKTSLNLVNVAK